MHSTKWMDLKRNQSQKVILRFYETARTGKSIEIERDYQFSSTVEHGKLGNNGYRVYMGFLFNENTIFDLGGGCTASIIVTFKKCIKKPQNQLYPYLSVCRTQTPDGL